MIALFLDAATGDEVQRYSRCAQAAVGTGTGVLGERKKLSTRQEAGTSSPTTRCARRR